MSTAKRIICLALAVSAVICMAVCGSAATTAKQKKPTIAVLEFQDNSGGNAPAGAIQDMLTGELARTGQYSILERAHLEDVAQEQRMSAHGLIEEDETIEMGHVKAARYKITGSITEYYYIGSGGFVPIKNIVIAGASEEAHVKIDLRVIDTRTSEIVMTARREGVANQTQGGLVSKYGGFGTGKVGGLMAQATYKCVKSLVKDIQNGLQ